MFENILVCPWKNGQQKNGPQNGAYYIANLVKSSFNFKRYTLIEDEDEISNEEYHKLIFYEKSKFSKNTLTIGGDHSIAIGSVLSTLSEDSDTCVIWIDAHPDIHTVDSSYSKNFHGMPLSFITGKEKLWSWTHKLNKLPLNNLYYFGIRDIDKYELQFIKNNNISILNDIHQLCNILNNYKTVHISFDVDSLDPEYMKSTGTLCDGGIPLEEIIDLFKYLNKISNSKNIHMDICEYNPLIGNEDDKYISCTTINKILNTLH